MNFFCRVVTAKASDGVASTAAVGPGRHSRGRGGVVRAVRRRPAGLHDAVDLVRRREPRGVVARRPPRPARPFSVLSVPSSTVGCVVAVLRETGAEDSCTPGVQICLTQSSLDS